MKRALFLAVLLAGCGGSAKPAPTATPVVGRDPCTVVPSSAVATALHAHAASSRRAGATCTYSAGHRTVRVQLAPATAGTRAALRAAGAGHGAVDVTGPGYTGYAQAVRQLNLPTSRQALVALAKGDTAITIVLTAPESSRERLVARAVALGRAAASS